MKWMVDLVLILLLSDLAGTLCFLFWRGSKKYLEGLGGHVWIRKGLNLVTGLYLFPLTLVFIEIADHLPIHVLPVVSPLILFSMRGLYWLSAGLFVIWGIGCIRQVLMLRKKIREMGALREAASECTDGKMLAWFRQGKTELGIRREVPLYCHTGIRTGALVGVCRPCILISGESRTEKESRALFLHELGHLKHHDNVLKLAAEWAACFHWMNPLMKDLIREVQLWSEIACDQEAARTWDSYAEYYEQVLHLAAGKRAAAEPSFSTALCGTEGELEERIRSLAVLGRAEKGFDMKRGVRVFVMVGFSCCVLLAGIISWGAVTHLRTEAFVYPDGTEYFHGGRYREDGMYEMPQEGPGYVLMDEQGNMENPVTGWIMRVRAEK